VGRADRSGGRIRPLVFPSLVGFVLAALGLVLAVTVVLLVEGRGEGPTPQAWRVLVGDAGQLAWVVLAAGSALLSLALRPIPRTAIGKWLGRRGLPASVADQAAAEWRRVRLWRTIPTVLAGYVAVAPVLAAELSVAVRGMAHPFSEAGQSRVYPALIFIGYLSGTVLAEVTRREPSGASKRGAVLDVRRPTGYLTFWARLLPLLVAVAILATMGLRALLRASPEVASRAPDVALGLGTLPLAALAVGLVVGVPALQRWIVQRPQRVPDVDVLALDDRLRSSAAHAVVGVCSAAGLVAALDLLGDVWSAAAVSGASGVLRWPLVVIGAALSIATIGVWVGYGSKHPGVRPASRSRVA
jgi:uncharacterized protein YjeT (DUF2065 family)